jgi:hypothetical protein
LGQIQAFEQRVPPAVKKHDSFTIWPAKVSASVVVGTRVKEIGIHAGRNYGDNPFPPPELLP